MAERPQVMLHGDFHWNNCVVDDNDSVGIIDFSGNDIGDPWYEFGGLLWALEFSYSFANGQIDGYFGTPRLNFGKFSNSMLRYMLLNIYLSLMEHWKI